jgi:hypothetical protein
LRTAVGVATAMPCSSMTSSDVKWSLRVMMPLGGRLLGQSSSIEAFSSTQSDPWSADAARPVTGALRPDHNLAPTVLVYGDGSAILGVYTSG